MQLLLKYVSKRHSRDVWGLREFSLDAARGARL
jgi:hypothetical protein